MIDSVSTPGWPRGAEHLDDHAFAVADVRREADHLDHDLVVRLHALRAGVADVNRVGEDLAVDLHHAHAGLLEIRADEAVGGPLDDVDDPAFELAHAAALRFEPHAKRCRRWRRRPFSRRG